MVTITGAVTPANSAQTSASGSASSSGTVSSFADQLATAINQVVGDAQSGSQVEIDISAAPRQDSDTRQLSVVIRSTPVPATSSAGSSPGSAATQDIFLQYLLHGASASSALEPGTGASTPSGVTVPSPSAPGARGPGGLGWLSPPYYTAPAQVWVQTQTLFGVPATTLTVESYLQTAVQGSLSDAEGFMRGSKGFTTPQQVIDGYIACAQSRCTSYPSTGAGVDPVALGTKYGQLVLDILKNISAAPYNPSYTGSIYDAWLAGIPVNLYATPALQPAPSTSIFS